MNAPLFEIIDNNIAVMRNRVPVKNPREDVSNSDEESNKHAQSDDEKSGKYGSKGHKNARIASARMYIVMAFIFLIAATYLIKTSRPSASVPVPGGDKISAAQPKESESKVGSVDSTEIKSNTKDVKKFASTKDWSHCSDTKPNEKPSVDKRVEPLWLPNYPTSLPGGYSDFLEALTGVSKGAKSYYRSSKGLKRCHLVNSDNKVDGVTCEIVHPIVPCNRPHPSAQAANFGKAILLALRNPLTAFPAYHQSKAEAYHGQKGQVEKEKWIEFRDSYVEKDGDTPLFDEWKKFVMEWRDMQPYTVEAYLPYEYWTDEEEGPLLVKKLAHSFQQEGFPVLYNNTSDEDFGCLWHKHIHEPLIKEQEKRAEEGWYEPDYTKEQLEHMAAGLESFVNEINQQFKDEKQMRPGDEHLIAILNLYIKTIREEI